MSIRFEFTSPSSLMAEGQKYFPNPGNIRELQHAIERAVIMSDSQVLQPSDFFFTTPEPKEASLTFDQLNLNDVEKAVIQKVIAKHSGNISKAARELGLTRTSLYRRLEKYGL